MPSTEERLVTEIEAMKKLLVLLLVKLGASGQEIAGTLGVSPASVSRMTPKGVERIPLGD